MLAKDIGYGVGGLPLPPTSGNVNMSIPRQSLLFLSLLVLTTLFQLCHGDIGTAARYSPPYTPTTCFGSDTSQFPSTNLFAAAGEGLWDNGAACGRQYVVRCISASSRWNCTNPSQTVQVRIVDRAQTSVSKPSSDGATIVLSTTAFGRLVDASAPSINVEFQEV